MRTYSGRSGCSSTSTISALYTQRGEERDRELLFYNVGYRIIDLRKASCFFVHVMYSFSLDAERDRDRELPFVMLDPGYAYLREAFTYSCFLFFRLYHQLLVSRRTEKQG